jgi:hypothetical protein
MPIPHSLRHARGPFRRAVRHAYGGAAAAIIIAASACGGAVAAYSSAVSSQGTAMQTTQPQYLYVWAGAVGRMKPDRLVTLDFNSASPDYGKVVADTIIPGPSGIDNEPHHCGLSANGRVLACGGLLASLRHHNWLFFFSLANPARPVLISSQKTPLAAFPDAFVPLPDNGFLVTMLGSLDGGAPGRVAEFNGADKLTGMYPARPPSAFNPHGIAVRADLNLMVTCDYVEPASTLNAVPGPMLFRSSVRIWNYRSRTITKTIELPVGAVSMDCELLPDNPDGEGYVGGTGNGQLYLFDSRTGTARGVFNFDTLAPGAQTQVMAVSSDGTRLFVPYDSSSGRGSGIAMFDVSHPDHPRLLDNLTLPPAAGPHMAMLDGDRLIVSDYFINEDNFGKIHADGDHYVRVLDVTGDRLRTDPRFQIDFNALIPGVELRPHGFEVSGMTMTGSD